MTKSKKYIYFGSLLGLFVAFIIIAPIYRHYYHDYVKKQPYKYCYETYKGKPNPVLTIDNDKYFSDYIKYHESQEKGEVAYINFPLKSLPVKFPVFILDITKDGKLTKIASYDFILNEKKSFYTGWVYTNTLHDSIPN